MAVNIVKIHHEGGGNPHDDPGHSGTMGYSIWIGPSRYTLLRPPWQDFATLNLNHVVMSCCFSGQRHAGISGDPAHPITDTEIGLLRAAVEDARRKGWVTNTPAVSPHDNLFGSATACPGSEAYARWVDIVNACYVNTIPPPAPEDDDMESYRYPHPADPNKFSGAVIDRANKRVQLYGNAKINQPTVAGVFWGTPNPNGILTSYAEPNGFCVVTTDSDEYHLSWV
jgi:hypothetical protein